jgi:hypothetical protein
MPEEIDEATSAFSDQFNPQKALENLPKQIEQSCEDEECDLSGLIQQKIDTNGDGITVDYGDGENDLGYQPEEENLEFPEELPIEGN